MNPLFLVAAGIALVGVFSQHKKGSENESNFENDNRGSNGNCSSEPFSGTTEYARRESSVNNNQDKEPKNEIHSNRQTVSNVGSDCDGNNLRSESGAATENGIEAEVTPTESEQK